MEVISGTELIAVERQRQLQELGWTVEHDAGQTWEDLASAGVCYVLNPLPVDDGFFIMRFWPWQVSDWHPGDTVRDLVRAGALIAAAIDRFQSEEP